MMNEILSVTQLNTYVKSLLDSNAVLNEVFIEGEISDLRVNRSSGHMYFSLKDEKSVVPAAMFAQSVKYLRFEPESGMKVIVRAKVSVYVQGGRYQLIVTDIQPTGVGAMAIRLAQLLEKLEKEGLFDKAHKKPLPPFPNSVGVITAPTGAAIKDIVNIISRRYPCAEIVLAPVVVQGDAAAESLTKAVNLFSKSKCVDVVIIGRGGGSTEDLWAFNDERLARAIYDCELPIISAVGHERDHTVCDYVCDVAAVTPSAAAEIVVPNRFELLDQLRFFKERADILTKNKLSSLSKEYENQLRLFEARSPVFQLENDFEKLAMVAEKAKSLVDAKFDSVVKSTSRLVSKAEALNPISVLHRGFSYITKDEKNVMSVNDVDMGDRLDVKLSDGDIKVEVV